MKYHKIAKPIAFALAAMLAIPPVSASAITFADINQVPWPGAEVSINKAAELKLVVGETINGKNYFKPKDPVSLTQTCQLAYKLLLETGKAKADTSVQEKWTVVMNTYKIQSWAFPAVSFCLENNIISISDLGGFVISGVNKSATREQAAEILGRALEVAVPAKKANATSTIFKDNANIAKDAIPYIALLNSEKIVNGDNLGKFNPKSTLNRTETAVMVTNLYNVLKGAATTVKPESLGTQSGTVKDMNSLYVNFENSNAYFLYASTGTTVTLNGDSATVAEIVSLFKNGETIKAVLTLDSNNRITKMVVTADADDEDVNGDEISGEIKSLSSSLIKIDNKSYTIKNKNNLIIKIDGKTCDFNDLMDLYTEEDAVEATITVDSKDYVLKIVVEDGGSSSSSSSSSKEDTVKGDIKSLSKTKIKIDSTSYNIKNSSKVTVKINGSTKSFDKLMDLYEDDYAIEATITLDKDDYVTKIDAEYDEDDIDYDEEGKVTYLADDEIELDDDDIYEIDDWTDIKIDGKSEDIEDMLEEYEDLDDDEYFEAKLVLDEDDDELVAELYLTKKVDDGDDEEEVEGEIDDIDDDFIEIDGDEYDLDSSVDIDIENGSADIDDLDDLIEAVDEGLVFEVTALVEDDEVTSIEGYIVEATGYLSDYDTDEVEIETDWGTVTYEFDDSDDYDDFEEEVEEIMDEEDLDEDDIEVTLEFEDGKVVSYSIDY